MARIMQVEETGRIRPAKSSAFIHLHAGRFLSWNIKSQLLQLSTVGLTPAVGQVLSSLWPHTEGCTAGFPALEVVGCGLASLLLRLQMAYYATSPCDDCTSCTWEWAPVERRQEWVKSLDWPGFSLSPGTGEPLTCCYCHQEEDPPGPVHVTGEAASQTPELNDPPASSSQSAGIPLCAPRPAGKGNVEKPPHILSVTESEFSEDVPSPAANADTEELPTPPAAAAPSSDPGRGREGLPVASGTGRRRRLGRAGSASSRGGAGGKSSTQAAQRRRAQCRPQGKQPQQLHRPRLRPELHLWRPCAASLSNARRDGAPTRPTPAPRTTSAEAPGGLPEQRSSGWRPHAAHARTLQQSSANLPQRRQLLRQAQAQRRPSHRHPLPLPARLPGLHLRAQVQRRLHETRLCCDVCKSGWQLTRRVIS
ncbi:hypothetical protein AAY473_040326 [Plecturocebus cupreus]